MVDGFGAALEEAHARALEWLTGMPERPIRPQVGIEQVKDALGRELADEGSDPAEVVASLATAVEPGLMAMQSPRFYGFVIGGTEPAALAADWLVSAWDQNTASRLVTPGVLGAEELAGEWLLDLLGLPADATVGFATGATAANLSCLLTARDSVLRRVGWDSASQGLAGGPRVRFLAGASAHGSVIAAGRMAGLGEPRRIEADDQGRIDVGALAAALAEDEGPVIVALQAGDIHSGGFDDFVHAIPVAHEAGAWVHIDGAFGLWAGASEQLRPLVDGYDAADSWATDAHKTLNVPYDCGVAIVRDGAAMAAALGQHAAYLPERGTVLEAHDRTIELSRRARGVTVWAALRSLGRKGVADLVDGLAASARSLAEGLVDIPGIEVLNQVAYTQVCVAMADDARTAALGEWLRKDSTAWPSSSTWHGRAVVRFSVSNYGTDSEAVRRTLDVVRQAVSHV